MTGSDDRRVFSRLETARIRERWLTSGDAACPDCETRLREKQISPHDRLPYVRTRVWLLCPTCARSVLVESPRKRPSE